MRYRCADKKPQPCQGSGCPLWASALVTRLLSLRHTEKQYHHTQPSSQALVKGRVRRRGLGCTIRYTSLTVKVSFSQLHIIKRYMYQEAGDADLLVWCQELGSVVDTIIMYYTCTMYYSCIIYVLFMYTYELFMQYYELFMYYYATLFTSLNTYVPSKDLYILVWIDYKSLVFVWPSPHLTNRV